MTLKKYRHPVSMGLLACAYGIVEESQNPMKKWRGRGAPAGDGRGADFRVQI
jgi:hypothetical protein